MLVETEVDMGSMDGISLPSCSPVEGMQAAGRCWFAPCTGLCVCAGYEDRCCSAGEEVKVTCVAASRERFLRLRG